VISAEYRPAGEQRDAERARFARGMLAAAVLSLLQCSAVWALLLTKSRIAALALTTLILALSALLTASLYRREDGNRFERNPDPDALEISVGPSRFMVFAARVLGAIWLVLATVNLLISAGSGPPATGPALFSVLARAVPPVIAMSVFAAVTPVKLVLSHAGISLMRGRAAAGRIAQSELVGCRLLEGRRGETTAVFEGARGRIVVSGDERIVEEIVRVARERVVPVRP